MPNSANPTPEQNHRIREVLRTTFFRGWSETYFASDAFIADLEAHVSRRFEECRDVILPWIEKYLPITGTTVVDIGCGSGASTAAWAIKAASVTGYDIHGPSLEAAIARSEILEQSNCRFVEVSPDGLVPQLRKDFAKSGIDVVILYAVLEHQTITERLETLAASWELLRPGGLLVVGDSPTRFSFMDYHTSSLPFFNWLPDELAIRYAQRSPRADFREAIGTALKSGPAAALDKLTRCGRGVGPEEFELAIGDLGPLVVGDSFDPEMIDKLNRGITLEDQLMQTFAAAFALKTPRGFLRPSLEVILRKPLSVSEPASIPKPSPVPRLVPELIGGNPRTSPDPAPEGNPGGVLRGLRSLLGKTRG